MTRFPFEVTLDKIQANPEEYISAVFSCLESDFLVLPKGEGFIEYPVFEDGYEALKQATSGFADVTPQAMLRAAFQVPISVIVVRTMLGFTPPEWAYIATQRSGIEINQGFVRALDRKIRLNPLRPLRKTGETAQRVEALMIAACELLSEGAPRVEPNKIHRLDKADTQAGTDAIRTMASIGVPYAMLLYERFLGRPFAGHRDSVSELIGDSLESKIEDVLSNSGISYRKTRRAERIPGFDQTPDFIIPSEFNPQVIIEAKITEDDGTARDKVTRVQHLAELSLIDRPQGQPRYEVIACIGGRGFGVRREDMRKLLYATRGKVFTLKTLDRLVDCSRLKEFRTR
ncbi:MAG: C15orf41 family protein [Chloroflexi bacterium]|nr:C15orf41 family protein [Chloroflexota bacterium]